MLERYKWLNAATAKIRFGPDRKAVRQELNAHLEDAIERRSACGQSEDEAEAAALAAMGDPNEIAEELGRLHRPWWGYLWRASQIVLAGAAAGYVLLLVLLAARESLWLLPGVQLYRYLTWESMEPDGVLEERELHCRGQIETGGYTVRVERAVLRETSADGRALYLDLDITLGRWEEPLEVWYALTGARSSSGEAEDYRVPANYAAWGFWQKTELVIDGLPEEAEWLELDFGYGGLRRTMRIDLTEVAEA